MTASEALASIVELARRSGECVKQERHVLVCALAELEHAQWRVRENKEQRRELGAEIERLRAAIREHNAAVQQDFDPKIADAELWAVLEPAPPLCSICRRRHGNEVVHACE